MESRSVTVVVIEQPSVDETTGDAFAATLESAVGDGNRPAIVDLSRVARIGTIGLRALVDAAKRSRSFFGVVAPDADVREILSIGRVDTIVPVFESLAEARSAVPHG